jgi:tripartite-type tricarboxylate transporter receptor subunit TctC
LLPTFSKETFMRRLRFILAFMCCLTAAVLPARAQGDYPNRPIKVVVPWGPAGFNDVLARLLADKMTASMGQPVVVENRPGATGTMGSEFVSRAEPDGYTILMVTADTHAIAPAVFPHLKYDPLKNFTAVSLLAAQPVTFYVGEAVPAKTMEEFVKLAKARNGALSYASIGIGSTTHLGAESFKAAAGIDLVHVPFKGSSQGITEVIGGRVSAILLTLGGAGGFVAAGKLRPLAIMDSKRSPLAPNVPTMKELGYPGVELSLWSGAVVPKGTPAAIVERIQREMKAALQTKEAKALFATLGVDPIGSTPAEFQQYMASEVSRWGEVAKKAKIRID